MLAQHLQVVKRHHQCQLKAIWVNNNMYIIELFSPTPDGYDTAKDDSTVSKLSDLRKTRLSLAQINRLRIMNDVRKFEHEKKLEKISKQYTPPAEPAAGV